MIFDAALFCAVLMMGGVCADRWRFPEGAESVRIDTKVSFIDAQEHNNARKERKNDRLVQQDEAPFTEAESVEGFYNRGGDSGRYPVRIETHKQDYRVDQLAVYPINSYPRHRETADYQQYCKCTSSDECNQRTDIPNSCPSGKVLCCIRKPNRQNGLTSEVFNEIDDERAALLPGRERFAGPFPPAPESGAEGFSRLPAVLVGPDGPTGHIGPDADLIRHEDLHRQSAVLAGPGGPTGIIGPVENHHTDAIHGPHRDAGLSGSAQRGVLVGPGGPTGIIGPDGYRQQAVLVGPGGPTGMIGPNIYRGGRLVGTRRPNVYNQNPGILVGPGGPTGIIGPGRQLLVGPGGPTGHIGPRRSHYDA